MISFIIPTLNEEKVLDKTLQALKKYQGPCEIIVSDGKSTDTTRDIAKKYTDKVLMDTTDIKQTIARGRSAGANIAQGEYFIFIDADVEIPNINGFVEKVIATFETRPNVVAQTSFYRVFPEMETLADKVNFKVLGYEFLLVNNILHGGTTGGEFMAVRANSYKKVGGFDETLVAAEDFDLFVKLSKIGRIYFQKDLYVYHTGRRAHAVGWIKLWMQWTANSLGVIFFKQAKSEEWTPIR